MALSVNTNLFSLNAQRNVATTQSTLSSAMQRLSSGNRVNSAKDDAAGLAIAERMNSQIKGMNVAIRNANDAISLSATAEGALSKVSESLQRMRELAVQSANGSFSDGDRENLDAEFQQLGAEVTRVLESTRFNGKAILGDDAGTLTFQIGASSSDTVDLVTTDMTANADVTAVTGGDITSAADASTAIDDIDTALDTVSQERANYGAYQNRFESIIGNLQVSAENHAAARGRIMDADFAAETANLSRGQILQQAGMAMLTQANAMPQQVLALLRG
jgi:flagellin